MTEKTKMPEMGVGRTLAAPFEETLRRAEEVLEAEGFGILTRIDVQATLKEKLGEEMAPFVILGACNPPLAHRALTMAPQISVLLPCNVVVRDLGEGRTRVEAINAPAMAAMFPDVDLAPIADEVGQRLGRALAAL